MCRLDYTVVVLFSSIQLTIPNSVSIVTTLRQMVLPGGLAGEISAIQRPNPLISAVIFVKWIDLMYLAVKGADRDHSKKGGPNSLSTP